MNLSCYGNFSYEQWLSDLDTTWRTLNEEEKKFDRPQYYYNGANFFERKKMEWTEKYDVDVLIAHKMQFQLHNLLCGALCVGIKYRNGEVPVPQQDISNGFSPYENIADLLYAYALYEETKKLGYNSKISIGAFRYTVYQHGHGPFNMTLELKRYREIKYEIVTFIMDILIDSGYIFSDQSSPEMQDMLQFYMKYQKKYKKNILQLHKNKDSTDKSLEKFFLKQKLSQEKWEQKQKEKEEKKKIKEEKRREFAQKVFGKPDR